MPAGTRRKNLYKGRTVDVQVVKSISFACTYVRFLVAFVKSKKI